MLSDLDLINKIKKERDSKAVTELVNRHTGIYMNIVDEYSSRVAFRHKANIPDLKEDNYINIYQWALKYDPSRGMQFGSYVGNMTKYMCKTIISRGVENVEVDEKNLVNEDEDTIKQIENDSSLHDVIDEVENCGDPKFKKIFKMRYGNKPMSWREISKHVDMTHEGARKFFNKNMNLIKQHATT